MPTGGVVKLAIDTDKTGYVRLPNGGILETLNGVINEVYTGVGGRITYYVEKGNTETSVSPSSLAGNIVKLAASIFNCGGTKITGLNSPNNEVFNVGACILLADFIAPKAKTIYGSGCALTAKSIGDILYQAYVDDRENVNFDFSGGNNALHGAVNTYLQATYSGLTYATVYALLAGTGTILID